MAFPFFFNFNAEINHLFLLKFIYILASLPSTIKSKFIYCKINLIKKGKNEIKKKLLPKINK